MNTGYGEDVIAIRVQTRIPNGDDHDAGCTGAGDNINGGHRAEEEDDATLIPALVRESKSAWTKIGKPPSALIGS